MKAAKLIIFFIASIISINISYAAETSSPQYNFSTIIISSGGHIVNGSNYKTYTASGIINGVVESSAYKNFLGFFYTWLLANGEQCGSASQCQGGFCCSGLCASSSCPVSPGGGESGGGGGGGTSGGGGGVILNKTNKTAKIEQLKEGADFTISPSSLKVKLALGESDEKKIKLRNTGTLRITIPLQVEGIKKYMSLSDNTAELEFDETKEIILSFIAKDVGAYAGEIIAKAHDIEKSVPIILEFISKLVLFDVKLDIPSQYAEVEPGQELKTQITLLNVGAPKQVDVFAGYFIKDLRGNIIYEETETFAVERQLSYTKSFKIQKNVPPGGYVAIAEIRYADSFAVSSQFFRVAEKKEDTIFKIISRNISLMLLLTFTIALVISVLAYKLVLIKRNKN